MASCLIPVSQLTAEDRQRYVDFHRRRNLFNKYSDKELRDWTKIDLYEALDLDGFRYADIPPLLLKRAIKKKLTAYHPIRNQNREAAFILIKQAEALLSTPKYRKLYDSVYFDERIPEDREYDLDEFLAEFSPVFERNSIFSEKQPVPSIGESIDVFYKFWHSFKSTRVYDDPLDVFEQRGSTRRYNAEQKKDSIQKRRTADAQRVVDLVKLAYKRDPRIKRAPTPAAAAWKDSEVASLQKFSVLLGKHKDKFAEIAKKLNHLYLTKRTPQEVKAKIETLKKK